MRYHQHYCYEVTCMRCHHRPYTGSYFLLDLLLLVMTGGLWVFWIIFRTLRSLTK